MDCQEHQDIGCRRLGDDFGDGAVRGDVGILDRRVDLIGGRFALFLNYCLARERHRHKLPFILS